jgi:hypothetical protein
VKGMLFSQMEPPPELEAEFNDWYEIEHIPVRLALPGFARALRYREADRARRYLAVYEIDDLAVLESPAYKLIKTQPSARTARMLESVQGFTRYTCTLLEESGISSERSTHLMALALALAPEAPPQLEKWYRDEHLPLVRRACEWLRAWRYSVLSGEGGPWTDFVLHELRGANRQTLECAVRQDTFASRAPVQSAMHWLYELVSVHHES